MMSLMCTSTAAKPARSNAAAISTWPFTPCSRRIAIVRACAAAMTGAEMFVVRIEGQRMRAGRDRRHRAAVELLLRAIRIVAQLLHLVAGLGPDALQVHAASR